MCTVMSKDAKYGFGRLIDLARADPLAAVANHWRPAFVELAAERVVVKVEEFERIKAVGARAPGPN
jgi:hypothetical protein